MDEAGVPVSAAAAFRARAEALVDACDVSGVRALVSEIQGHQLDAMARYTRSRSAAVKAAAKADYYSLSALAETLLAVVK